MVRQASLQAPDPTSLITTADRRFRDGRSTWLQTGEGRADALISDTTGPLGSVAQCRPVASARRPQALPRPPTLRQGVYASYPAGKRMTVDVEAKAKELAVLRLAQWLRTATTVPTVARSRSRSHLSQDGPTVASRGR